MKRFLLVFILVLISNISFAHQVSVTDLYGREVIIPEKVEKVIAIGAGSLRLMVYAGAENLIIGKELIEENLDSQLRPYAYSIHDSYYKLPVAAAGGPGVVPDVEAIKKLDPDVIFVTSMEEDRIEDLHRLTGKAVVGLNYGDVGYTDLEKVKESIRLVGYVTHTQKYTQAILNNMAMLRKDIISRTAGLDKKTVYMASIALKGDKRYTSSERNHPVVKLLGLNNIADELSYPGTLDNHINISLEKIIAADPDYIFFDITGLDVLKKNYSSSYPELMNIRAVREGRMFSVLPYNWYNSNIENIFINAYFIGKIIYPESFADLNMKEVAHDIYSAFIQVNPYEDIIAKYPVNRRMVLKENGIEFH